MFRGRFRGYRPGIERTRNSEGERGLDRRVQERGRETETAAIQMERKVTWARTTSSRNLKSVIHQEQAYVSRVSRVSRSISSIHSDIFISTIDESHFDWKFSSHRKYRMIVCLFFLTETRIKRIKARWLGIFDYTIRELLSGRSNLFIGISREGKEEIVLGMSRSRIWHFLVYSSV